MDYKKMHKTWQHKDRKQQLQSSIVSYKYKQNNQVLKQSPSQIESSISFTKQKSFSWLRNVTIS